ncbi:unnamed protein product [Bursaphelenchus okinawaensis]|uniref:Uncharacterized protein n=1 Tax=Bursaphelenchus okinawaensis TaxID=465554 RepID=A0A811LM33_9BILA|nr:unnamed protein product [Bursaphelenchus okinawaensis]CAG9124191.1 unnamed protein product [Bursaphelenchus okinawaensis]
MSHEDVSTTLRRRNNKQKDAEKPFQPEDDPEYDCCVKVNLHKFVICMSAVMCVFYAGLCFEKFMAHSFHQNIPTSVMGASIVLIISYVVLLVGAVFRIRLVYLVFFIVSAVCQLLMFCAMIAEINLAQKDLYRDPVKKWWNENRQNLNTMAQEIRLLYILVNFSMCTLHIYTDYLVYRDYCFVYDYPRKHHFKWEKKILMF